MTLEPPEFVKNLRSSGTTSLTRRRVDPSGLSQFPYATRREYYTKIHGDFGKSETSCQRCFQRCPDRTCLTSLITGHCPLVKCNKPEAEKAIQVRSIPSTLFDRYSKWVKSISSSSKSSLPRLQGIGYSRQQDNGSYTIYYHLRFLAFRQIHVSFSEPRWYRRLKYRPWIRAGIDYRVLRLTSSVPMEWHRMKSVPSVPKDILNILEFSDNFRPIGFNSTYHLKMLQKRVAFGAKSQTRKYGYLFLPSWEDSWEPRGRVSLQTNVPDRVDQQIMWGTLIRHLDSSWMSQYNDRN